MPEITNQANKLLFDINIYWKEQDFLSAQQEYKHLSQLIGQETDQVKKNILENHLRLRRAYSLDIQLQQNYIESKEELKRINLELKYFYEIFDQNIKEASPRYKFLIHKQAYLNERKKIAANIQDNFTSHLIPVEEVHKKSLIKMVFDASKKLFDGVDDAWNTLKSTLSPKLIDLLTPFLVGSIGFIIHFFEGYEGGKDFVHAILHEKIPQKRTRLISGGLTFMLAGAGTGMSIALLTSAFGVSVVGASLLPALIPGLLTTIYSLALWRNAYIFKIAREEEKEAEKSYQESLHEALIFKKQILDIRKDKKILIDQLNSLQTTSKPLSEKEKNDIKKYACALQNIIHSESQYLTQLTTISANLEARKACYEIFHEKRLESERELAFKTVEVVASALTLVGTIFTLGALIGAATVASFGIAPMALLITGMTIGFTAKIFESVNEKFNYSSTTKIRNWLTHKWQRLTHSSKNTLDDDLIAAPMPFMPLPKIPLTTKRIFEEIQPNVESNINQNHRIIFTEKSDDKEDSKEEVISYSRETLSNPQIIKPERRVNFSI